MGKCDFLKSSIIAHRGIYNNITIFENTMESIMYAVKNNLIVEIDVRLTSDNELIVFHDDDAGRLIKLKDDINTLTYEELEYLSPYHIPTLKEVLVNINSKVPIIIEVKEDNKIIRNKLIEVLKNYKGNFAIQSFIYDAVKFYKKKKYIVGLLVGKTKNRTLLKEEINVDFLNIKYDTIDRVEANKLKEKYFIIGYTINKREDVDTYIKVFNNLIIDNIEEVFG